jgi:selenocysteine-specific elongation factor
VESEHDLLRIAGFDPFASLSVREREWLVEVEGAYRRSGLEPPALQAIVGSDQGKENMYRLLLETGRLVRLRAYDRNSQTVLHAKVLEDVQQALSSRFPPPQPFALKDVRDLLGSTRKHVLPLMEHLDSVGVTVRTADLRRLRDR